MHEIVRTAKKTTVTEDDLISLAEASRISGKSITALAALLERGSLPWYQLRPLGERVEGERIQRFTSRRAVEALPRRASKPRAGKRAAAK